jgi:multidrug resistance efflux pump
MHRILVPLVVVLIGGGGGWYYVVHTRPTALVLTGIVTTHDVVVAPQIAGRLVALHVKEGDAVKAGELVAEIDTGELQADRAYYEASAEGMASQVRETEAALRLQERQLTDQITQAEAEIASAEAQRLAAVADAERARVTFHRTTELSKSGLAPAQQLDEARTAFEAAQARVEALARQVDAEQSALALARANQEQVAIRRSQVQSTQHQLAAAGAQRQKANVRLGYSKVTSPIDGVVDVQAARQGEVVSAGQAVLTLINPDDLWVRADVEETYVERIRNGDTFTVRLPSGEERSGTVFYRRADAAFATQRDVSRTKRDIRTFETRLRVDNADRRLAVGMTVYVLLPLE